MLTDAQVERYARQIVLPEVGGRGQARLLASHVVLAGDADVCRHVRDLLTRAGVHVHDAGTDEPATVRFDLRLDGAGAAPLGDGTTVLARVDGSTARLSVLPAAPCPTCAACPADQSRRATRPDPLARCARHALAALAATEGLLATLDPARAPRRFTIDLASGTFHSEAFPDARCAHGGYRP